MNMTRTMFDILFGSRFEPIYEEREIEDVDYVDVTDEIEEEPKLIEDGSDNSRPNQ